MNQRFLMSFAATLLFLAANTITVLSHDINLAEKYTTEILEKHFIKLVKPGISDVKAKNLIGILAPILANYPESIEGNATAKIAFEKSLDDNAYVVEIELNGILDDSVTGQRFVAFAVPEKTGGWKLQSLWLRQKCARGIATGKWIRGNCG